MSSRIHVRERVEKERKEFSIAWKDWLRLSTRERKVYQAVKKDMCLHKSTIDIYLEKLDFIGIC
jgi:GrpB-like predicted nucleotidyltransferase (UPF0157 family)